MTVSWKEQSLTELCALMQLYLQQEYPPGARVAVSPENFDYFKRYTAKARAIATTSSLTSQPSQPLPPLQPSPLPPQSPPPPISRPPQSPPPLPSPNRPVAKALPPRALPRQSPSPSPPPPPTAAIKSSVAKDFALSAPPPPPSDYGDDMLRLLGTVAPHLPLLSVPEPTPAAPVLFLTLGETAAELSFFEHIARAVTLCLGLRCRLVSAELWLELHSRGTVQLTVAHADNLQASMTLAPLYRYDPESKASWLGTTPLLQLSDLSLLMKQPSLKAALWQSLRNAIARACPQLK